MLGCHSETVQKIWKRLDESNAVYKDMAVRKHHADRSLKKRTLNLWLRSKPWLTKPHQEKNYRVTCWSSDNNWQWSQQYSHVLPGTLKCLSFLLGSWCMRTFGIFHKRWGEANFYHRPWRTRGKTALPSFSTNSSQLLNRTFFGFTRVRKNSDRIKWWTHRTTAALSSDI